MAIYVGAGGVKTPTAIYVGAGGVKTVSAVYVGVGSVKQVWPAWQDGDMLFPFESGYWTKYTVSGTNKEVTSSALGNPSNGSYSDGKTCYNIYWSYCRIGNGGWVVSNQTVNATNIKYIIADFVLNDTSTNQTAHYYYYSSVGSSSTSDPRDDSGCGEYGSVSANGSARYDYYSRRILIDLTGCTRTGYYKFGIFQTGNNFSSSDNTGRFYLYGIEVYNSKPSSGTVYITVT